MLTQAPTDRGIDRGLPTREICYQMKRVRSLPPRLQ